MSTNHSPSRGAEGSIMTYFVTGHKGFIGSHLTRLLDDWKGYDLRDGNDILDYDNLADSISRGAVVIHLAARVSVPFSWEDPELYFDTNMKGTLNVINAAIEKQAKKIIFASSSSVYDPFSSPYALSKRSSEMLLEHYSNQVPAVALRFFNVYGTGQNREYAGVITAFWDAIREGKTVTIYGDGEQTRDFTHVHDIRDAIKRFADIDIAPIYEAVDIGKGIPVTVNDLLSTMQTMLGFSKVDTRKGPMRHEVRFSKAETALAEELVGFKAQVKLLDGLRQMREHE